MEVKQVFPIFKEGRILKRESLDLIRDYAPDYFSLLFGEYGDGVIAGFPVRGQGRKIVVGPGILKDGPCFFSMKEEVNLEYGLLGRKVQVILKKLGSFSAPDFVTDRYGLSLETVRKLEEGEYELGRFLLEPGARLRTYGDYRDFNDLETAYNTLNPIYIRFACEGGSTLSPFILRLYGKGVLNSPKAGPLDQSFGVACLNGPCVPAGLIQAYLRAKKQGEDRGWNNLQMYQGLKQLYACLVSGEEPRQRPKGISGKTMID